MAKTNIKVDVCPEVLIDHKAEAEARSGPEVGEQRDITGPVRCCSNIKKQYTTQYLAALCDWKSVLHFPVYQVFATKTPGNICPS